jgi:hypothetical protein
MTSSCESDERIERVTHLAGECADSFDTDGIDGRATGPGILAGVNAARGIGASGEGIRGDVVRRIESELGEFKTEGEI